MSKITYKNAIHRTLNHAIAAGTLPRGTQIRTELKDGTIAVWIENAPFDCMKPGIIEVRDGFITIKLSIGNGRADQTDECNQLIDDMNALIADLGPAEARARVYVGGGWSRAQGNGKLATAG